MNPRFPSAPMMASRLLALSIVCGSANAATCSVSLADALATSGGKNWNNLAQSTSTGSLQMPGLSGSVQSTTDLKSGRYVDRANLGVFAPAEGFDGKVRWTEESPGDLREEDSPLTRAETISERYDRTMAYWFPERMPGTLHCDREVEEVGVRYSVFAIEPKDGRPFELWINGKSKLIERKRQTNGPQETVTRYSDFRAVASVRVPFQIESERTDTQVTQTVKLQKVSFAATLDESAFAKPQANLNDYALADGASSVTVKFRLINNHTYVPVMINGRGPYQMILDTGGQALITPRLARELGVKGEGDLKITGAGEGAEPVSFARLDQIQIGGVTLRNQMSVIVDLEPFGAVEGVPQYGLVGYEVFKRLVTRIDYENSTLTFTDPKAFQYRGNGTIVPFEFREIIPIVKGSIDGVEGQFVIDTGSRSQLWMNGPFADTNGFRKRYPQTFSMTSGWGVGGAVKGQVARGGQLRIGDLSFDEPLVDMSLNKKGASADPHEAGNIGAGLMKRYAVTFDYPRKQMIFEARAKALAQNDLDRSGLWINREETAFVVVDVAAGGPGEAAGLRAGDRLLKIAQRGFSEWTLPELREFLQTQKSGTTIPVGATRDGKAFDAQLKLRDLVTPLKSSS